MRKVFLPVLVACLLISLAGVAFAQLNEDANTFYGQGLITLPSGDFGDIAGNGIGFGAGMNIPYSDVLDFRAELGYVMYGSQDLLLIEYSYSMIPILALGEYHFAVDGPGYALGGVGLTMVRFNTEWDYEILGTTISGDDSASSTEFCITLGGGYQVNEKIAVEGRFNLISDSSYLSVHGTYQF